MSSCYSIVFNIANTGSIFFAAEYYNQTASHKSIAEGHTKEIKKVLRLFLDYFLVQLYNLLTHSRYCQPLYAK